VKWEVGDTACVILVLAQVGPEGCCATHVSMWDAAPFQNAHAHIAPAPVVAPDADADPGAELNDLPQQPPSPVFGTGGDF
jgi:hypothetical protein